MTAPKTTSETQCSSVYIREMPHTAAMPYSPMDAHVFLMRSARTPENANATIVWPKGRKHSFPPGM